MNPPTAAFEQKPLGNAFFQALERHELRRCQGIPTLSVLVGPAEDCAAAWLEWTAIAKRRGAIEEWPARNCLGDNDLPETCLEAPAAARGSLPQAWLFVPPKGMDGGQGGVLNLGVRQKSRILQEAVNALTVRLEALTDESSRFAFALAVSAEMAKSFLRDAPECRAKALFREGWIDLSIADAEPNAKVGDSLPSCPNLNNDALFQAAARTALALTRQRAGVPVIERFQEAALAWENVLATSAAKGKLDNPVLDRARSAAERFLFELLDELPETKGCFALNATLGFCFGPKPLEVDLLSSALHIALEIDGYRHFQDAAAYRRDRHKDALLQTQGYLVLRFLAEDVVTRLEEILDQIRETIAFRRVTMQPSIKSDPT